MATGEIKYQIDTLEDDSIRIGESEAYVSDSVLAPLSGANGSLSGSQSEFSNTMQKSIEALLEEDGKALKKALIFYSKGFYAAAFNMAQADDEMSKRFIIRER